MGLNKHQYFSTGTGTGNTECCGPQENYSLHLSPKPSLPHKLGRQLRSLGEQQLICADVHSTLSSCNSMGLIHLQLSIYGMEYLSFLFQELSIDFH
jgi:hypothetical protein